MSTSERIRALGRAGHSTTAIANALDVDTLTRGGFAHLADWTVTSEGRLSLSGSVPGRPGVYAFVVSGVAMYVGVATVNLTQRLHGYGSPGASQVTNLRLRSLILDRLAAGDEVQVYVATPPDTEWNGLPVNVSAGLELGLIRSFLLPWNSRSAG